MKLFKRALLAFAAAAVFPISAHADIDWRYNWLAADTALGVPNVRPLSNITDELKFTAESIVRFNDNGDGVIGAGDTFTDYIVVRVDQLFNDGNNNGETGLGYQSTREITLTAVLTGVQTDANNYSINPGGTLSFWYDSGAGYTSASFANLATFVDGNGVAGGALLAETGTTVAGSGGINSTQVPDGSIDVIMALLDQIAVGDFEVDTAGFAFTNLLQGIADANNNRCVDSGGTASCFATQASIQAFFGIGGPGAGQFQFHTRSDGSMIKVAIPEPGSLAVVGLALAALGFVGRRKK